MKHSKSFKVDLLFPVPLVGVHVYTTKVNPHSVISTLGLNSTQLLSEASRRSELTSCESSLPLTWHRKLWSQSQHHRPAGRGERTAQRHRVYKNASTVLTRCERSPAFSRFINTPSLSLSPLWATLEQLQLKINGVFIGLSEAVVTVNRSLSATLLTDNRLHLTPSLKPNMSTLEEAPERQAVNQE